MMNAHELITDRLRILQDKHSAIESMSADKAAASLADQGLSTGQYLAMNRYGQSLLKELLAALPDE